MRWKPLLISWGLMTFLVISFIAPITRPLWNEIDIAIFKGLNASLKDNLFMQSFWSLVNHKKMDLVEDIVFLIFFIACLKQTPQVLRWDKGKQILLSIVMITSVVFFINRHLLREHIIFPRESPSLVVQPCYRISQEIPWKKFVKDETKASFPGDHATTLLLFGLFYASYAPGRLKIYAWVYVVFRTLPRLILGAHWFSDIAVGSVCLSLFFTSCVLYTPIGTFIIKYIEQLRWLIRRMKDAFVKNNI